MDIETAAKYVRFDGFAMIECPEGEATHYAYPDACSIHGDWVAVPIGKMEAINNG